MSCSEGCNRGADKPNRTDVRGSGEINSSESESTRLRRSRKVFSILAKEIRNWPNQWACLHTYQTWHHLLILLDDTVEGYQNRRKCHSLFAQRVQSLFLWLWRRLHQFLAFERPSLILMVSQRMALSIEQDRQVESYEEGDFVMYDKQQVSLVPPRTVHLIQWIDWKRSSWAKQGLFVQASGENTSITRDWFPLFRYSALAGVDLGVFDTMLEKYPP